MAINHEDAPVGEIHKFINWEFATVTELEEFNNIVAADFHKVAYVAEVQGYFAPVSIDAGSGDVTWIPVGGSGLSTTTNLASIPSPTNVVITSSTGTDATIAAASDTLAGVMLPAQVTKLESVLVGAGFTEGVQDIVAVTLVAGANVTVTYDDVAGTVTVAAVSGGTDLSYIASNANGTVVSNTGADAIIPLVDVTNAGLMSPAQSTKLAGINIGTAGADVPNNTQLNTRLGTSGNLGTMAQQNANAIAVTGGTIAGMTSLGVAGNIAAVGRISASGLEGFASTTFVSNARNPIWRFGNADTYGLSFFQGTSGYATVDGIGMHFGTATAAGSPFNFSSNGTLAVTGTVRATIGFAFPTFLKTTVPSAAANPNVGIIVTDAASGRRPYWSNGTNWMDAANVILS